MVVERCARNVANILSEKKNIKTPRARSYLHRGWVSDLRMQIDIFQLTMYTHTMI